jgi:ribonuclease HI
VKFTAAGDEPTLFCLGTLRVELQEFVMNLITIHTDGSCETQTRLGGWAAVLACGDHQRLLQGSAADTTVNAMELKAVIEALKALKQAGSSVQLFSDSNYVVRGVNEWLSDWLERGWKNARGEQVANLDLWQQLKALLDQHTVTLIWIPRGQNAQADKLAQVGLLQSQKSKAKACGRWALKKRWASGRKSKGVEGKRARTRLLRRARQRWA